MIVVEALRKDGDETLSEAENILHKRPVTVPYDEESIETPHDEFLEEPVKQQDGDEDEMRKYFPSRNMDRQPTTTKDFITQHKQINFANINQDKIYAINVWDIYANNKTCRHLIHGDGENNLRLVRDYEKKICFLGKFLLENAWKYHNNQYGTNPQKLFPYFSDFTRSKHNDKIYKRGHFGKVCIDTGAAKIVTGGEQGKPYCEQAEHLYY